MDIFQKFIGNQNDMRVEIQNILKDGNNQQQEAALQNDSKPSAFIGATPTSNIQKIYFQEVQCAIKEMALIRFFNLKQLIQTKPHVYKYLFDIEEEDYKPNSVGLKLIKKFYIAQKQKNEILKPVQFLVTHYDQEQQSLNMIMKRMQSNQQKFPLTIALYIIKCIADSLQMIHSKNLCHGNVCPNNIFINQKIYDFSSSNYEQLNVNLIDCGMHYLYRAENPPLDILNKNESEEKLHVLNEYQSIMRAQVELIAPELKEQITNNQFEPTSESDIYQLGICLLCMCDIKQIKNVFGDFKQKHQLQDNLIFSSINELELQYVK